MNHDNVIIDLKNERKNNKINLMKKIILLISRKSFVKTT